MSDDDTNIPFAARDLMPKGPGVVTIRGVPDGNFGLNLISKAPGDLVFNVGSHEVVRFHLGDDGVIQAKYDPADLDTAAQALIDEVNRRLGGRS